MKVMLALLALCAIGVQGSCPNGCSGHGTCNQYDVCDCDKEGKTTYFGYLYDTSKGYNRIRGEAANRDVDGMYDDMDMTDNAAGNRILGKGSFIQEQYTGADCSLKTCSRGVSWTKPHKKMGSPKAGIKGVDMAGDGEGAVLHQDFAECSDQGNCDRATGLCACFPGYEGAACQRTVCENGCSGHGTCQSNVEFAEDASTDVNKVHYLGAWDSGLHMGCKCDVGFRGPDCSMKECPSGSDPLGWHGADEGEDCSGRGLCNYDLGICECFPGFTNNDCGKVEALS